MEQRELILMNGFDQVKLRALMAQVRMLQPLIQCPESLKTLTDPVTMVYALKALVSELEHWKEYPTTLDKEYNAWFVCPFPCCEQVAFFPSGNGGIQHTRECPFTLAMDLLYVTRTVQQQQERNSL